MGGLIRLAVSEDAKAILAIYEPYIFETAITFETAAVPLETFRERMAKVQSQFPWLVYEADGEIIGYAYASLFKERAAFAWDCEFSVYIRMDCRHRGIGTALYTRLFELVSRQGYFNVYALITYPNESSEVLHKKFGFETVGIYKNTGYKMGKWWDLLVMVKRLRTFEEIPKVPKSIGEIYINE